jgi:tRNA-2-methylthio-N6-dimethylallyladenosine synthase
MLAGRTETNKMVHAPVPDGSLATDYTGRIVDISITEAQTWFLSGVVTGTTP